MHGEREKVGRVADDIRAAFNLRSFLRARKKDRRLEFEENTVVFYAVDSPIIYERFGVESDERKEKTKKHYSIFQGAETSAERYYHKSTPFQLSQIILTYLLECISGRNPVLLLPGHSGEAKSAYQQLAASFNEFESSARSVRNELEEYLDTLSSFASYDDKRSYYDNNEDRVFELLYVLERPHERARAYHRLLREQKLMKTQFAATLEAFSPYTNPLSSLTTPTDYSLPTDEAVFSGSREWWRLALEDHIPDAFLKVDVVALEALENINRLLLKKSARLVLFTNNSAIMDAGRTYFPYSDLDVPERDESFTDLYLRDPVSLLVEPAILNPSHSSIGDKEIETWIEEFLELTTGRNFTEDASIRVIEKQIRESEAFRRLYAGHTVSQQASALDSLYEKWNRHTAQLCRAHATNSELAFDRFKVNLRHIDASKTDVLREFDEELKKAIQRTWSDFFNTVTKVNYLIVDFEPQEKVSLPRRVPPIFLLDSAKTINLASIFISGGTVFARKEEIFTLIKAIKAETDSDDANYLESLSYALLFAYAGRWDVTQLLCERAAAVADYLRATRGNPVSSSSFITGREANYILATAIRMNAKSKSELKRGFSAIDKAISLSEEESIRYPKKLTGIRFESAKIALDTANLFFDLFVEGVPNALTEQSASKCLEIMEQVDKLYVMIDDCESSGIRRFVRMSIIRNYFSVVSIIDWVGGCSQEVVPNAGRYLMSYHNDLQSLKEVDGKRHYIPYLEAHLLRYMLAFLGKHNEEFSEYISAYDEIMQQPKGWQKEKFVQPYDKHRYSLLKQLIRRAGA